jgi:exonuclease SbcD
MIRIAHFSDLHYSHKMLEEADRCFAAAIDRAIELGAEVAVISGDATDHALDLHAPAARTLLTQVCRLAHHCPVLMLQGTMSHEPPGTLSVFRLLGTRHPVHVSDKIEQVALTSKGWLASAGWRFDEVPQGRVLFSCLPAVNKAVLVAAVGVDGSPAPHVDQLLAGLVPTNTAARLRGMPTVGVSHGTVFGCTTEHGVPMAGFDHEFTTGALFGAQTQAFLLGHIHKHQTWQQDGTAGHQCIAYAGSIGRFHHGEAGDKGFLLWTVDSQGAHCTLHPTPARRTLDIHFEGPPDMEALRAQAKSAQGAWVRLRWQIPEEDRNAVDHKAIESLFSQAKGVQIEARLIPVQRTRTQGWAQATQLADKVRLWAEVAQADAEPLLAALQQLQTMTPEQIAQKALSAMTQQSGREAWEKGRFPYPSE